MSSISMKTVCSGDVDVVGGPLFYEKVDMNRNGQLNNIARKRLPLQANETLSIANYNGGSGYITKIWLATYKVPPGQHFVQITIDGIIVAGSYLGASGNGMNATPLAADLLFTNLNKTAAFRSEYFGCNMYDPDGNLGGYISIRMPFTQSFDISLINSTSVVGEYWSQTYFEKHDIPMTVPSKLLRLYIQPFRWTSTTYPNEYPLLSTSGPNGVYLKGIRFHIQGISGAWAEGRFKIYTGGPGMTAPMNGSRYNDTNNSIPLPYDPAAKLVLSSSGTEDFFDSSWNWFNETAYTCTEESGMLYNSEGFGNRNTETSVLSLYRMFGHSGVSVPCSMPNENLVFSWSCGDPQTVAFGSATILGHVFYYA